MDDLERDRRDSPDAEDASSAPAEPTESDHADTVADATGDADVEATSRDPDPSEIESWPSQAPGSTDAASGEHATVTPDSTEPAWPTEPPAAGSGAGGWPTEPPERGDQPVLEPEWSERQPTPTEPAPSEVEAYPATPAAEETTSEQSAVEAPAAHAVPAAASEAGESTQCPRCGTENRPGLSFCNNCGQRLIAAGVASTVERPGTPEGTMACPRCGTHNRAGVAFCQNCGANLRGTAPGYVPPSVAGEPAAAAAATSAGGAVLGPVVLLIGVIGLITGYLLPFLYGSGSLLDRAIGGDGYGIAFWAGYPEVGADLADQAYFGLAGPVPLLAILLVILAVAGFMRARPGPLQSIGLGVALLWSVGLIVLFAVIELAGNWDGDIVGMLRVMTPAGIIFFLASLIVVIGTLTRFGRS
ncbi:MAG: zinc ribbon domain-containing protein [Chloroflexi bacterium]|nr:zinc ribbon domain-containing protein [Chloroflexota bacterium]